MTKNIILASESPRRKELLTRLGLNFIVMPAEIEEDVSPLQAPQDLVKKNAFQKACHVSKLVDHSLVIGADTMVVLGNYRLGKPVDEEDAYHTLSLLSGKQHEVITGLCVIDTDTGDIQIEAEITKVFFRNLTDNEINAYIASGDYKGKAGSYAIQSLGAIFVDRIEGCYYNVVGLPITRLYLMLKKQGVTLWGGANSGVWSFNKRPARKYAPQGEAGNPRGEEFN
ncbi:MAG: Maf family protein [Syntrophomonadaceae bacterium]|jgi:septum formation protein